MLRNTQASPQLILGEKKCNHLSQPKVKIKEQLHLALMQPSLQKRKQTNGHGNKKSNTFLAMYLYLHTFRQDDESHQHTIFCSNVLLKNLSYKIRSCEIESDFICNGLVPITGRLKPCIYYLNMSPYLNLLSQRESLYSRTVGIARNTNQQLGFCSKRCVKEKTQKNGNPSHLLRFKKCLLKQKMKKSCPFISFKNILQEISVFIGNSHSRETNRGEKTFFSYS